MSTTNPADAVRRFAETLEWSINVSVSRLVPRGRTMVEHGWSGDRYGDTVLTVVLDDGSRIVGTGPAKLEALADAAAKAERL